MQQQMSLNSLRIIIAAMAIGVVGFGVVAGVIGIRSAPQPEMSGVLLALVGAVGVGELGAYYILRRVFINRMLQALGDRPGAVPWSDAEPRADVILPQYLTLTLLSAAMVEGLTLFSLLGFLLSRAWPLLVVSGLGALVLLSLLPTRAKVERMAEVLASGADPGT